jgi:hypothetical protein
MSAAEADARRAASAAEALRRLVGVMRDGGDVVLWSDNAAKCLAKHQGRPVDRKALVDLGAKELLELSLRLDAYVESVRLPSAPKRRKEAGKGG